MGKIKKLLLLLVSAAVIYGVFSAAPCYNSSKEYKNLSYYVMYNGKIKIFSTSTEENKIDIPEKIDGKEVAAIASKSIGFDKDGNLINGFIVNGYTGSAAENYAKKSGLLFNCLHKFKDTITKPATYSTEGDMLRVCKCGYSYTEKIARPAVPKVNLLSIGGDGNGEKITWEKIKGIKNYYVYKSTDSGEFEQLADVKNDSFYSDTAAKSGANVKYYVLGYAGDNIGKEKSAVLSDNYLQAPVFRLSSGSDGVNLTWTKCDAATGYYIYRKGADGKYAKIKTINGASTASYTDTDVTKKNSYTYAMRSFGDKKQISGYLKNGKTIEYGKNAKVVYLTFDDGPSDNTLKILNILKKYNAKATFFVTANGVTKYMKNIVDAGCAIGLHTYSHNYSQIYSSVANYFSDLQKIHDLVQKETGIDSKIIRFPGGASNTISASYSKGIMSTLTKQVEQNGYSYFDWNVSSGDAEGDGVPADRLIHNVRRDTGSQSSVVVLMHDTEIKKTTVAALPSICEYYQSKGYEFDVLTTDSPVCHQGVNN